mmetsp:Transcript_30647/g.56171  ORF Transcript_30647/g.56171 Transcript_30647/m.56171 type:complete len:1302 (-) Transcript_30647:245-4150(-)
MSSVSLGFDTTVDRHWDTASLAQDIANHLNHKGFCVVDPKLEVLRKKVVDEVEDSISEFAHPPAEVVDGLLGLQGSSLIYDVGTGLQPELEDDQSSGSGFLPAPSGMENIAEANNFLTTIAQIMHPVLYDALGIDVDSRTSGILHVAGDEPEEPPELTKDSCDEWMSTFMWHRLMIMLYVGPRRGTLEMQVFNEEANAYLAELDPGALVLLRPDVLTHRLDADPSSVSLTMFLQNSVRQVPQWVGTGISLIPVAARLDRWIGELIAVHSSKAKMESVDHTVHAYRVVQRAVSKLEHPRADATVLGIAREGEILRGVEVDVGARQGLESEVFVKVKLSADAGPDDQAAWLPKVGKRVGLGTMVEKVPVETWRVFERRVFMLAQPDVNSSMVAMASKGDLVFGYSRRMSDGTIWLNTVINEEGSWQEAWMATTGAGIGKGMMLEKVPNAVGELPLELQIMQDHQIDKSGFRSAIRVCGYRGPGTYDAEHYVKSLFAGGTDYGIEAPEDRFDLSQIYEPDFDKIQWLEGEVKLTCKHATFTEGLDMFSAKTFNITPAEAAVMDPQQRCALELTQEGYIGALGNTPKSLLGKFYGVYVGGGQLEWNVVPKGGEGLSDMFINTGYATAIQANRTSYVFGFRGPSVTYEADASSAMVALSCAHESLNPCKDQGNQSCIVMGMYVMLAPIAWPHLSRCGVLRSNSDHARSTPFDASTLGYIKGEGVLSVILERMFDTVEDELVVDKDKPIMGAVAGCATAYSGQASVLHAPHAPSKAGVALEALSRGKLSALSVDYTACFGDGRFLHEATEARVLEKVFRQELPQGYSLPFHMDCVKGSVGDTLCSCALYEVIKIVMACRYGMMCGTLHLRQLNPNIEFSEQSQILTESLHTRMRSCFASCSTDSMGGTVGHAIIWGEVSPEKIPEPKPLERQKICFWPGGGGELLQEAVPDEGYFLVGSWNSWTPEPMEQEKDGEFVAMVNIGINCFEKFQIWIDGKDGCILHPNQPWAGKRSAVSGPDEDADGLHWVIDGRPVQSTHARSAEPLGVGDDWWKRADVSPALRDAAADDDGATGEPSGGEAQESNALGLYEYETPDTGKPGDEYKVTLQIRGKWRSISWEKHRWNNLDTFMDAGTYFVTADWASWTFEEMRNTEAGNWELEVFLDRRDGHFQIVRDKDWDQVFHPEPASWNAPQPSVMGPASNSEYTFQLVGNAGDVFRIKFYRSYADNTDNKRISWEKIRSMDSAELVEAQLQRHKIVRHRLSPPKKSSSKMDHLVLGSAEDGEEGIWTSGWKIDHMVLSQTQDGEE